MADAEDETQVLEKVETVYQDTEEVPEPSRDFSDQLEPTEEEADEIADAVGATHVLEKVETVYQDTEEVLQASREFSEQVESTEEEAEVLADSQGATEVLKKVETKYQDAAEVPKAVEERETLRDSSDELEPTDEAAGEVEDAQEATNVWEKAGTVYRDTEEVPKAAAGSAMWQNASDEVEFTEESLGEVVDAEEQLLHGDVEDVPEAAVASQVFSGEIEPVGEGEDSVEESQEAPDVLPKAELEGLVFRDAGGGPEATLASRDDADEIEPLKEEEKDELEGAQDATDVLQKAESEGAMFRDAGEVPEAAVENIGSRDFREEVEPMDVETDDVAVAGDSKDQLQSVDSEELVLKDTEEAASEETALIEVPLQKYSADYEPTEEKRVDVTALEREESQEYSTVAEPTEEEKEDVADAEYSTDQMRKVESEGFVFRDAEEPVGADTAREREAFHEYSAEVEPAEEETDSTASATVVIEELQKVDSEGLSYRDAEEAPDAAIASEASREYSAEVEPIEDATGEGEEAQDATDQLLKPETVYRNAQEVPEAAVGREASQEVSAEIEQMADETDDIADTEDATDQLLKPETVYRNAQEVPEAAVGREASQEVSAEIEQMADETDDIADTEDATDQLQKVESEGLLFQDAEEPVSAETALGREASQEYSAEAEPRDVETEGIADVEDATTDHLPKSESEGLVYQDAEEAPEAAVGGELSRDFSDEVEPAEGATGEGAEAPDAIDQLLKAETVYRDAEEVPEAAGGREASREYSAEVQQTAEEAIGIADAEDATDELQKGEEEGLVFRNAEEAMQGDKQQMGEDQVAGADSVVEPIVAQTHHRKGSEAEYRDAEEEMTGEEVVGEETGAEEGTRQVREEGTEEEKEREELVEEDEVFEEAAAEDAELRMGEEVEKEDEREREGDIMRVKEREVGEEIDFEPRGQAQVALEEGIEAEGEVKTSTALRETEKEVKNEERGVEGEESRGNAEEKEEDRDEAKVEEKEPERGAETGLHLGAGKQDEDAGESARGVTGEAEPSTLLWAKEPSEMARDAVVESNSEGSRAYAHSKEREEAVHEAVHFDDAEDTGFSNQVSLQNEDAVVSSATREASTSHVDNTAPSVTLDSGSVHDAEGESVSARRTLKSREILEAQVGEMEADNEGAAEDQEVYSAATASDKTKRAEEEVIPEQAEGRSYADIPSLVDSEKRLNEVIAPLDGPKASGTRSLREFIFPEEGEVVSIMPVSPGSGLGQSAQDGILSAAGVAAVGEQPFATKEAAGGGLEEATRVSAPVVEVVTDVALEASLSAAGNQAVITARDVAPAETAAIAAVTGEISAESERVSAVTPAAGEMQMERPAEAASALLPAAATAAASVPVKGDVSLNGGGGSSSYGGAATTSAATEAPVPPAAAAAAAPAAAAAVADAAVEAAPVVKPPPATREIALEQEKGPSAMTMDSHGSAAPTAVTTNATAVPAVEPPKPPVAPPPSASPRPRAKAKKNGGGFFSCCSKPKVQE
eukprot:TRINITY_DN547_c0_g1_i16.p1 TRINITY_DN547_c0_g1~~TRINITY_DN547_c0_g1_i16.p1  ORF type:complete len:1563 (-),score=479.93 TRINITY_DN547_c0_g1_i16:675-5192(-)